MTVPNRAGRWIVFVMWDGVAPVDVCALPNNDSASQAFRSRSSDCTDSCALPQPFSEVFTLRTHSHAIAQSPNQPRSYGAVNRPERLRAPEEIATARCESRIGEGR